MIEIDGEMGEGGGQIVRSSLALSLITSQPVRIENIRANRKNPGLRKQHSTAVNAAAEIGSAEVTGASVGSREIVFQPREIKPGKYTFDIRSAGSTGLVIQTIIPVLLTANHPSHITLIGGTHNPLAPPYHYLKRVYFPILETLGGKVSSTMQRLGFYPKGGGMVTLDIQPAGKFKPFELLNRGKLTAKEATILIAKLPLHVEEREKKTIQNHPSWQNSAIRFEKDSSSLSPGNAVFLEILSKHCRELVSSFGEINKRAERVAKDALKEANRYLQSDVPVGEHLADQLMLLLAIGAYQKTGGGRFRTLKLSDHSLTHLDVIRKFMDLKIRVTELASDDVEVSIFPVS